TGRDAYGRYRHLQAGSPKRQHLIANLQYSQGFFVFVPDPFYRQAKPRGWLATLIGSLHIQPSHGTITETTKRKIEGCARYWYFVDVI
ncbi:hypothetical protein MNBD_ACTINO02-1985, partial [hydrothermal vent metagenome]